ncbi:MAG: hypothetical protein ACK5LN_09100 [Propioniciclava sp.]
MNERASIRPPGLWVGLAMVGTLLAGITMFVLFAVLTGHGSPLTFFEDGQDWSDVYDLAGAATATVALVGGAMVGALVARRQLSDDDWIEDEVDLPAPTDAQSSHREVLQTSAHSQAMAAQMLEMQRQAEEREAVRVHVDRLSRMRDRFTAAAGQLGGDSAAVRLAGVYAIAALADEWLASGDHRSRAEAQMCIDILCGYFRTQRDYWDSEVEKRADTEVRQSIVRIMAAHLQKDVTPSWNGFDFDFTDAVFDGDYSFARIMFTDGRMRFDGAKFCGGLVWFDKATLAGGRMSFDMAEFSGGWVSFGMAEFAGGWVSFEWAKFSGGRVWFIAAVFSGGQVSGPWGDGPPPKQWPISEGHPEPELSV